MRLDNNQQAFFTLIKAGLFPVHGEGLMVNESLFHDVDWKKVYQLAQEQAVVGLAAAGIERFKNANVNLNLDPKLLFQIICEVQMIEQRNRAMNAFIADLIEKLRKHDIYALLVKGQGIAQCYEKPLWRSCGDVDLLLSNSNYKKAKEVLLPLATDIEQEYTHFKHLGLTIDSWVVELHGTMHSRLSRRVDNVVDKVQKDVSSGENVRPWENGGTTIFLPSPDNDVIFVFTHILHHFFFEGIGLRQICDWCRLLYTYKDSLDKKLLESRIKKAGLMTEWKAFGAFAVDYLGMPLEAMSLLNANNNLNANKKKADKICKFIMKVGNFGHKQRRDYSGMSYIVRKVVSFWGRLSDMLRHFKIFPKDSIVFFGGVLRSGLHAAVRGE